jgi:hypothetical protein
MNSKKILVFMLLISIFSFSTFASDFNVNDIMGIITGTNAKIPATFNTENISAGLDDFTFSLIKTAPSTVSHQNMWASAYIGQLLDLPPHLGGGISMGMAQLKTDGIATVLKEMGLNYDVKNLFLPTLTFDARIGGLLIPFDLGVHGMMIKNPLEFNIQETFFSIDYGTVGADIRFPLVKQNAVLPNLSLGFGYAYSKGNAGISVQEETAKVSAGYESQILQATVQVSKKILIVEPFVGLRGTISSNKRNWSWNYDGTKALNETQYEALKSIPGALDALKEERGYDSGDWSGFDINKEDPNYTAQIFAGVGIDFLFIGQGTINVSFDLVNQIWAGGLSLRVKF